MLPGSIPSVLGEVVGALMVSPCIIMLLRIHIKPC